MFMSEEDKQIYSMVQRLSQLGKEHIKEKREKGLKSLEVKRKREQKVQEKRDEYSKQNR